MIAAAPLLLALWAAAPPGACAGLPAPEGAHCGALARRPRLPLPSAADRAALRQVYASPALRRARADPDAARRLLLGLWQRLLELLAGAEAERYAGVARAVYLAAGLAAALAGLAALRRRRRPAPAAAAGEPGGGPASPGPPPTDPSQAHAALARGDVVAAVRLALLSTLDGLARAGRLPGGRCQTNGELAARLVGVLGPRADDFRHLTECFDRAVYGGGAVAPPEAAEAIDRARRILAEAGAGR